MLQWHHKFFGLLLPLRQELYELYLGYNTIKYKFYTPTWKETQIVKKQIIQRSNVITI